MTLDPLSPVAPARVRALLLPIGRISRSRFASFVERLAPHNVVRLGDVSPDNRPNRTMFSPLAFPTGSVLYEITTSISPPSYSALSPFELFRESLMIITIADNREINYSGNDGQMENGPGLSTILEELEEIRAKYPKALVHQALLFDYSAPHDGASLPEGILPVPPPELSRTTTMKTVMCDLTSLLLGEMTTFAKALQDLPTLESPGDSQALWSSTGLSRPSSQMSESSRPVSPSGSTDRNAYRMSMPASISTSSEPSGTSEGRPPLNPSNSAPAQPPTTFDEIAASGLQRSNSIMNTVSRSSAGTEMREHSRDRISLQKFGTSNMTERAKNKGRARIGLVIGTLYLHAGRWGDAVRELVENASIAKANSDHLWHAKGLENILVCLLLFAWVGMDFQIPQICYPIADKSSAKSPHHTPSGSSTDLNSGRRGHVPNRLVSLQNLTALLPDLLNNTINLYNRAANFSGEALPQTAFSEAVIRYSKLLTAVHLSNGHLDDETLQHLITNAPLCDPRSITIPRSVISPTRTEIVTLLFRAMPPPSAKGNLSVVDHALILSGIASVLGSLGLSRKKSLVVKEMLLLLVPALVQARKLGAAEAGVHPAAGLAALSALNTDSDSLAALDFGVDTAVGIREFLAVLGHIYGVVSPIGTSEDRKSSLPGGSENVNRNSLSGSKNDSNEEIIERIMQDNTRRMFGSHPLKMNILRTCINLCEALPDFQGVLQFTTDLLRTAASGIAVSPNDEDWYPVLIREDQLRLAANISRTIGAARKLGLHGVAAEYWDEFLVRGVKLEDPPLWKRAIPHANSELKGLEEHQNEKSPFIYNPFSKKASSAQSDRFLVAGEPSQFTITLQNPNAFDLEIEHMEIESEGVELDAAVHGLILGAYTTEDVPITAIPRACGQMKVSGCVVKIKGCRRRRFPIFRETWRPEHDFKVKSIGLAASRHRVPRPMSTVSVGSKMRPPPPPPGPKIDTLDLNVIKSQPVLVISGTSLPQSSIMLLEGEVKTFTVTVENISPTTPVDFLLITFHDSTESSLKAAISNKHTAASELFELERMYTHQRSFRWRRKSDEAISIEPKQKATFEIEVLGNPSLTSGLVQVDYAYLGAPRAEIKDKFYTRQVTVPVTVTVNASINLLRVDLLPLSQDIAWAKAHSQPMVNGSSTQDEHYIADTTVPSATSITDTCFKSLLNGTNSPSKSKEHCLLQLDLQNAWPRPLAVTLNVLEPNTVSGPEADGLTSPPSSPPQLQQDDEHYSVQETIQPGHISRILLLIPRIFVQNPYKPIPAFNPATRRQFIVSSSTISPDVERTHRAAFWYREEILKRIQGTWHDDACNQQGEVDLRTLRLSPRMIEAVRVEELGIEMSISGTGSSQTLSSSPPPNDLQSTHNHTSSPSSSPTSPSSSSTPAAGPTVHQTGHATFLAPAETFLILTTRLHNRTDLPILPLLRLQPSLANQPLPVALDLSKRFAWTGLLQRPLPLLQPGATTEVITHICALCKGTFEIGATVEEIRPAAASAPPPTQADLLEDPLVAYAGKERRVWHARESCVLVARDSARDALSA
ncbi:Trs120-domain-containing protein [Xylona heveae TC161]|uniref:Trs120-domain-containing protein n=1 Tax=Xylona heveae (strain CBS 132557 / TC161) TaxID=1328760 RepID=A0A165FTT6_XYLHT|nr:Trs120-domain-containing protein [Xylona heveae TC161]KZF21369.1 Trs120-domain-containing protein [Xylona heveae TC161]